MARTSAHVPEWFQPVRELLEEAPHKLSRHEILLRWSSGQPPLDAQLHRWLEHAVDQGLARKDGGGRRGDPFRYWLVTREEQWRQDPIACLLMPELRQGAGQQGREAAGSSTAGGEGCSI